MESVKKYKKLKIKQRRAEQLRRMNPQREKNPVTLPDFQVERAEAMLNSDKHISRGQRKRLAKKEKFVNQRLMEKKFKEQEIALKKADQEAQEKVRKARADIMKMAKDASDDMAMDDSDKKPSASKAPKKKTLNDFSAMGDLLDKIGSKVDKQVKHQQRAEQGKRQQVSAIDRDKERLNKIGSMAAFTDNTLDNLFLHVSNTVAQSKQQVKK